MAEPPAQRLNYFKHQFLTAADFLAEQAYHIRLRRLHNRALHTSGVAQGLGVKEAPNDKTAVDVDPGLAIDPQGREIYVTETKRIPLASFSVGQAVWIFVEYKEDKSDPKTAGGVTDFTRWTEDPKPDATTTQPPAGGAQVVLAKATRTANGVTVDEGVRVVAGTLEGEVSISPRDPKIPSSKWVFLRWRADNLAALEGHLRVAKEAGVGGDLSVDGRLGVKTPTPQNDVDVRGVVRLGAIEVSDPATGNLQPDCWIGTAANVEGATRWLHVGGITDAGARRIALFGDRIFGSGRLGLGVTNPANRLDAAGGAFLRSSAWIAPPGGAPGLALGFDPANGGGSGVVFASSGAGSSRLWLDGNPLIFAPGGAERARFDGAGNLAIGTTAPGRRLHVEGSEILSAGPGAGLSFGDRATTGLNDTAGGTRWVWYSQDRVARLWTAVNGDVLWIKPNGNIGLGTVDPQARLHVVGDILWGQGLITADQGGSLELGGRAGVPGVGTPYVDFHFQGLSQDFNVRLINDGNGQLSLQRGAAAGTVTPWVFTVNGNALSTGWIQASDRNLKKNVRTLAGALDRVRRLEGVRFEWKRSATRAAGLMAYDPAAAEPQIGLLADQFSEQFPELVTQWEGADGKSYSALDYGRVTAVLVEAIKELADRVDALAARIEG